MATPPQNLLIQYAEPPSARGGCATSPVAYQRLECWFEPGQLAEVTAAANDRQAAMWDGGLAIEWADELVIDGITAANGGPVVCGAQGCPGGASAMFPPAQRRRPGADVSAGLASLETDPGWAPMALAASPGTPGPAQTRPIAEASAARLWAALSWPDHDTAEAIIFAVTSAMLAPGPGTPDEKAAEAFGPHWHVQFFVSGILRQYGWIFLTLAVGEDNPDATDAVAQSGLHTARAVMESWALPSTLEMRDFLYWRLAAAQAELRESGLPSQMPEELAQAADRRAAILAGDPPPDIDWPNPAVELAEAATGADVGKVGSAVVAAAGAYWAWTFILPIATWILKLALRPETGRGRR